MSNRLGRVGLAVSLVLVLMLLCVGSMSFAEGSPEESSVTIMLFETDIREALSEISIQTGINIIPDQSVSGVVTADIQDMPLEKALRMLIVGGGYTYRKIDDFYLVGLPDPRSTTFGELVETEVVALRHVSAETILAVLPTFLQSYVRGGEGQLLTITAPPSELRRIKQLIDKLDAPQKQIEVKVVVTEVSTEAAKELGNTLLRYHPEKGQEFEGIDLAPRSFEYDGAAGLLTINADVYGTLLTRLRLLQEKQDAKIHADPKVLVADGETAELFSGEQRILLIESDNDDYTSRIEEIEVGIRLQATARVVGEEDVVLELAPEISHFVGESRPDLIVRQDSVATTIRVKSGQTAVLAGLTMQNNSNFSKKVPIVGDIPLIRWLFRNDRQRTSDRELLVFVTPVIQ